MPSGAKKGERRGGRAKGTPNVNRQELQQTISEGLAKSGFDPNFNPLVYLAQLAADPIKNDDLRFSAAKEVAQYLFAKRKAIEHSGNIGVEWMDVLKQAMDGVDG